MANSNWQEYWKDHSENHEIWKRPSSQVLEFIDSVSSAEYPNVLDLGCGLGRHTIAFASAGYQVHATDSSEDAVQHTLQWAEQLDLSIRADVCDMLAQPVEPGTMDIVISFNVIYHGTRERFAQAIQHAHALLRPSGLFWFTCPSRKDGKYGYGPEIEPHTYAAEKSITPGDVHYFTTEDDLRELLQGFQVRSITANEGIWDNKDTEQFFSNYIVVTEKL